MNWHSPATHRTNRSSLIPPVRIVVEEKGWWEGEDSPEADPSPEAPDSSKEVDELWGRQEEGEWSPVVRIFAVLIFICITALDWIAFS